jgi:hypothetical protein
VYGSSLRRPTTNLWHNHDMFNIKMIVSTILGILVLTVIVFLWLSFDVNKNIKSYYFPENDTETSIDNSGE